MGMMALTTPFALGYAFHARRGARDRGIAMAALVLASLEFLVLTVLAGLWAWYLFQL